MLSFVAMARLNFQLAEELLDSGINVVAITESSSSPFIKPFSALSCLFLSPLIFLKGIKSYLKVLNSPAKIIHNSYLERIEDKNGKKVIHIRKKKKLLNLKILMFYQLTTVFNQIMILQKY